ncbi:MAG: polysaccharide deacetylase family protein [Ruminococcaceae bacterium]|nr:polysaccharide deacetylase family protein [Oscillospiraceae bacterium]
MKIKAVLLSLIIAGGLTLSGCTASENNDNNNSNVSDSSGELSEGIVTLPDEDALNGLKTADARAERIGVAIASGADNTLIGWGLGRDKDGLGRPIDAVKAQEKYGGHSALFIDDSESKNIYLTFDEGYENGYTGAILDTLKKAGVKATFFVTYDYCVSAPDLVERMIAEGHTVGNHSYSHPSFPSCTEQETENEVKILHDYVKDNFGYEMTFFRFPMGEFSERTLIQLENMGYTSVFWSFAYQDWNADKQPTAAEAFDIITSATHSGGIYLLHAVSKANSDALGDVLDYWKTNGFTIADINDLAS